MMLELSGCPFKIKKRSHSAFFVPPHCAAKPNEKEDVMIWSNLGYLHEWLVVGLVFIKGAIILCHPLTVNQTARVNLFMWPTDTLKVFGCRQTQAADSIPAISLMLEFCRSFAADGFFSESC